MRNNAPKLYFFLFFKFLQEYPRWLFYSIFYLVLYISSVFLLYVFINHDMMYKRLLLSWTLNSFHKNLLQAAKISQSYVCNPLLAPWIDSSYCLLLIYLASVICNLSDTNPQTDWRSWIGLHFWPRSAVQSVAVKSWIASMNSSLTLLLPRKTPTFMQLWCTFDLHSLSFSVQLQMSSDCNPSWFELMIE